MAELMSRTMSFMVSETMRDRVLELAYAQRVTYSELLREFVSDGLMFSERGSSVREHLAVVLDDAASNRARARARKALLALVEQP